MCVCVWDVYMKVCMRVCGMHACMWNVCVYVECMRIKKTRIKKHITINIYSTKIKKNKKQNNIGQQILFFHQSFSPIKMFFSEIGPPRPNGHGGGGASSIRSIAGDRFDSGNTFKKFFNDSQLVLTKWAMFSSTRSGMLIISAKNVCVSLVSHSRFRST